MKAYKHLVKHALSLGHTVSVYDGEEWAVKVSTKYTDIINAIESVEQAELIIRDPKQVSYNEENKKSTKKLAWVGVIPFGMDDSETVYDYSDNEYMAAWDKLYDETQINK